MVERPRPRRYESVFVEAATEAEVQRLPFKSNFRLGELVAVPNRGVFRVRGLRAHIEPDYEGDEDVWQTIYRVERVAVHRRQEAEGAVTLGIPMERDL